MIEEIHLTLLETYKAHNNKIWSMAWYAGLTAGPRTDTRWSPPAGTA